MQPWSGPYASWRASTSMLRDGIWRQAEKSSSKAMRFPNAKDGAVDSRGQPKNPLGDSIDKPTRGFDSP